jgi:hypothetical protein
MKFKSNENATEADAASADEIQLDEAVSTKGSRLAPATKFRMKQKVELEAFKDVLREERREERNAAIAAKAAAEGRQLRSQVKPVPLSQLGRPGERRQPLTIDTDLSREQCLTPGALRLLANNPNVRVGAMIDVLATDFSWGDTWLVIRCEPHTSTVEARPIPGRYWTDEPIGGEVEFEDYVIRPMGADGWRVFRKSNLASMDKTHATGFASPHAARHWIVSELHTRPAA